MPPDTLSALYWIISAFFFVALVFLVLKKIPWAGWALSAGTLACGAGILLLIITEQRLPLYGAFESALYMIFILSLLERLSGQSLRFINLKRRTGIITCSVMLFFLALQINAPKQFHPDRWTQPFHEEKMHHLHQPKDPLRMFHHNISNGSSLKY